jgi:hypothetical protein
VARRWLRSWGGEDFTTFDAGFSIAKKNPQGIHKMIYIYMYIIYKDALTYFCSTSQQISQKLNR